MCVCVAYLIFNLMQNLLKLTSNISHFGLEYINESLSESVKFLKEFRLQVARYATDLY